MREDVKDNAQRIAIAQAMNREKDKAIAHCWSESSIKPMTDFIKRYEEVFDFTYEEWVKASLDMKWLSIIKTTKESKNVYLKKYKLIARKKEKEITEKLKSKEPLPFD